MKKAILYFVITTLCASVQGQSFNKKTVTGSWINTNVADFYESNKEHACDINYFDNDKFVPLYLSFENESQLKITFRIEQRIFTYKVNHTNSDSISISRGENIYKIYLEKDVLKLRYRGNLITFKKVSDNYSSDVFGEFIKDIIFRKHKNFTITSFKESNNYNGYVFRKNNFKQKLKELFKCDQVDVVQLGSFKSGSTCLPEIALYYNAKNKMGSPRVLGIITDTDNVEFIDNSGTTILTLKPN